MYDIGILGGMGPEATAEIFRRIVTLTLVDNDQDHLSICVLCKSEIPDRSKFIEGLGQSPLPYLLLGVNELKNLSIDKFIVPCNTSHFFADYLRKIDGILFIDMVESTKEYLVNESYCGKVLVLGSNGTYLAKIYGSGEYKNLEILYPEHDIQKMIIQIILSVKANSNSVAQNRAIFINLIHDLKNRVGDCVFIIACTELSILVADEYFNDLKFVDAMEVLAVKSILMCGFPIRTESTRLNINSIR